MGDKYSISVIIPTYNRSTHLNVCLSALALQTIDATSFEVIVVNDGGKLLQTSDFYFPFQFQIINLPKNGGPGQARNSGASAALGTMLAFTDDDCQAAPEWLETILENCQKGHILGGLVKNALIDNFFSETSQLLIDFLYEENKTTPNAFFTTNNIALFQSDFKKIGPFDRRFTTAAGEDREFGVRANRLGITHQFCSQMIVYHYHEQSLIQFYRLHKKYGSAAFTFRHSVYETNNLKLQKLNIKFYFKLLSYPFKQNTNTNLKKKLITAGFLLLSQIAVVHGFGAATISNKLKFR